MTGLFSLTTKRQKKLQKFFSGLAIFSLFLQIGSGIFYFKPAFAEGEVTPTPTLEVTPIPEPTVEPTPTLEATPTPTLEVTSTIEPTPTVEPTPEISQEATPTPIPTEEITSTPTVENNQPTQENSAPPNETSPPAPSSNETPSATPSENTPTPTVTVEQPTENGQINAVILKNVKADSVELDLVSEDVEASATLVTDKADYAPTDTVLISGSGFNPNETYTLIISSTDEPPVNFEAQVTADENGTFVYAYQLDGNYRPNYKVEAKDSSGNIISSTTFLDHSNTNVEINSGAEITDTLNVTLNISWSGGGENPTQARYTNDTTLGNNCSDLGTGSWAAWEAISATKSWTLVAGSDGERKVCIETAHGSVGSPTGTKDDYDTITYSSPSSVQTITNSCVEDATGFDLNCTANDVSIATVSGILIQDDGCQSQGDTVTFTATWDVQSTSTERYNIGLYFASAGQSSALNGSCSVSTLPNSPVPPWFNFDGNACGDISSSSQVHPQITMTVACSDPDGDNILNLPYCTSWAQNDTTSCSIPEEAVAGSPAKCNCKDGFEVPIFVPSGNLTVIKHVINDNGGTAVAGDFNITVTGTNPTPSSFVGEESPGTSVTVDAGSYSVTETPIAGYTPSYSAGCSGTMTGGGLATCTITNDDIAPTLTLVKTVVTDNGGTATQDDFNVYIDGQSAVWGENTTTAGRHTASEDPLTGYTPSNWGGDCATDGTITLAPGDNKTCTITNDDEAPTITLIKNVVNDNGGNAGANDFGLTIGGTSVNSNQTLAVDANTSYVLNEAGLSGYTFVSITGDGCPSQLGDSATLDEGEDITCTITNDDIAPTLKLVKEVTKDDGGQANPGDWTLTARRLCVAGDPSPSCGFSDSGDSTTFHTLMAGRVYSLSESGPSGYTMGSWNCDGGSLNGNRLTLNLDDEVTCTITNDDEAPKLTLVKVLPNDNGGTATQDDFNVYIDGQSAVWGENTTTAGRHTASEDPLTGYTPSNWGGDCATDGTITLAPGDNKTCTITNDDQPGKVTVCKYNDYNGNGSYDSQDDQPLADIDIQLFRLHENAESSYVLEDTKETSNDGCVTFDGLTAGVYKVAEDYTDSDLDGYYSTNGITQYENIMVTSGYDNQGEPFIFLNTPYRTISGQKYDDLNENGQKDAGEPGLQGWDIYIDSNFNNSFDGGEDFVTTDADGNYQFTNLVADLYRIREVLKNGWAQTQPVSGYYDVDVHTIITSTGNDFGNRAEKIALTLDKTHDKMGMTANRGDILNFTLKVSNTEKGTSYNVTVQDSLPDGFSYVPGTTGGTGWAPSEPTIDGNKLTWNVGEIVGGGSKTITYQVKISDSVAEGSHANVAVAFGFNRKEGKVYSNFDYVYTAVGIGISYSVSVGGAVLGAATGQVLGAATGSPTIILIMAILMILAGLAILIKKGRKFHV